MTSGGQCVMITGTTLMQQWSASSWDMHTLEVRMLSDLCGGVLYRCHGYYFFATGYCAATI